MWIPISLPAMLATSSTAAAMNTDMPPTLQLVRSPVLRKNTGISSSRTCLRKVSIWTSSNHLRSR